MKEEGMEARSRLEALGWLLGVALGLVACALLGSCKGKERVVERLREVHDTAWMARDSMAWRSMAFDGEVEERTAEWTSRGDSSRHAPDTVWRWRWRTVRAQGSDSSRVAVRAEGARQRTDSTATVTAKGRARQVRQPSKKGRWPWQAVLWLLGVVAGIAGGMALGKKTRKE